MNLGKANTSGKKVNATIANEYHKKYYCDSTENNTYTTKPDCLNKITRLSLPEFSLYTKEPLSLADYEKLVRAVEEMAKRQQPNVHLLLSTMAVRTADNHVLNMSLFNVALRPKSLPFLKRWLPLLILNTREQRILNNNPLRRFLASGNLSMQQYMV